MEASYFCKGVYGYCDGYDGTCGYCWDFTFINIASNREETPPLVLGKQQLSWSWKRKSWSCLFLYINHLSILSPSIVLHLAILRAWLLGFKFSNHKWVFHHCTLLSLAGNFVALQVFSFVALREVEILDLSHPSFKLRRFQIKIIWLKRMYYIFYVKLRRLQIDIIRVMSIPICLIPLIFYDLDRRWYDNWLFWMPMPLSN